MAKQTVPPLPLPKHWPRRVRSAAVHAIALAQLALTTARGQRITLVITHLADRRHLPNVELKKAA
jgi:hypothetical protein